MQVHTPCPAFTLAVMATTHPVPFFSLETSMVGVLQVHLEELI